MLEYAGNFIPLSTMDYSSVWWRLFHSPSKTDCVNALTLAELLFSIPASNGKVERVLSTCNVIKIDLYCQMSHWTTFCYLTLTKFR